MASFWLLMVFLVCASGQEHGSQNSEEYRQRFVKIVQDGQRDALNYHLPTDASKYRGSVRNCFWNPFRCFIRRGKILSQMLLLVSTYHLNMIIFRPWNI